MKIRFGYVALPKTLGITSSHTITYSNYEKIVGEYGIEEANSRLSKIVELNLNNLEQILLYNIRNNIHFYRMSSNIFPLATHPNVTFDVLEKFKNRLEKIGKIINDNDLRVDIHLDQFCVLNSVNNDIVKSTINIIKFYKNMLNSMNLKTYMIIHVGSSAFGKQKSITRFINNFGRLDDDLKKMIILENDDKVFNINDVLYICCKLNIPMVLDYHHYICNHDALNLSDYIAQIINTWNGNVPKIHLSSSKSKKEFRSHNDFISVSDFISLLNELSFLNCDIDVMIEAKEKDYALFKLIRELKYLNYKFIDDTTLFV